MTSPFSPSSLPAPLTMFEGVSTLTPYEIRKRICKLELAMQNAAASGEFIETDFPLLHEFSDGFYIRTIFLPKGTLVVGRIHKKSHFNYISKGSVAVMTEHDGLQFLQGPWQGHCSPGLKRAIYCFEDTWWTVVHETALTDIEAIRKEVIAESYTELGWDDPVEELKLLEAEASAEGVL